MTSRHRPSRRCSTSPPCCSGWGAEYSDVAKLTSYVVDWTPEKPADLGAGAGRAAQRLGVDPRRRTTLVGVAALSEPDLLIEVEAIAVLD